MLARKQAKMSHFTTSRARGFPIHNFSFGTQKFK